MEQEKKSGNVYLICFTTTTMTPPRRLRGPQHAQLLSVERKINKCCVNNLHFDYSMPIIGYNLFHLNYYHHLAFINLL